MGRYSNSGVTTDRPNAAGFGRNIRYKHSGQKVRIRRMCDSLICWENILIKAMSSIKLGFFFLIRFYKTRCSRQVDTFHMIKRHRLPAAFLENFGNSNWFLSVSVSVLVFCKGS